MLFNVLKKSFFVRGLYFLWARNFGNIKRNRFGYIADSVILSPPLLGHTKNVYIYEDVGIGPYAHLSTPKAKIIFKGNTVVAEHFTVHTGNHHAQS